MNNPAKTDSEIEADTAEPRSEHGDAVKTARLYGSIESVGERSVTVQVWVNGQPKMAILPMRQFAHLDPFEINDQARFVISRSAGDSSQCTITILKPGTWTEEERAAAEEAAGRIMDYIDLHEESSIPN